jgi:uncharacterized delta-60 repeat protein
MATVGTHQQSSFTTPVNGTSPIDANEVRLNDNNVVTKHNSHDNDPKIHVQSSTVALRPAAGTAERVWVTTDNRRLSIDSGSVWNSLTVDAGDVTTGTLAIARGGTGQASTPTNGQLLIGNGTGFSLAALTAGTNISITNSAGGITIGVTGLAAAVSGTGTGGTVPRWVGSGTVSEIGTGTIQDNGTNIGVGGAPDGTAKAMVHGSFRSTGVAGFNGAPDASFAVTANGNLKVTGSGLNINNVAYTLPGTQGAANTVLVNNGSGTLTWSTVNPVDESITPTADSPYTIGASDVNKRLVVNTSSGFPVVRLNGTSGIATGAKVSVLAKSLPVDIQVGHVLVESALPAANNSVSCLAVNSSNNKIAVGGNFTTLNNVDRSRLGLVNADGTVDTGFANPSILSQVNAVVFQSDGKIVVGGNFTSAGGSTRNYIARFNTDGTLDSGYNPNLNNSVNAMAVQSDGKIVIGGTFTTVGGTTRNYFARLNTDGTLDTAFDADVNNFVFAVAIQSNGSILLGGSFATVGTLSRSRIARVGSSTGAVEAFNPSATNGGNTANVASVDAIAVQSDGKIVFGGNFNTVGATTRNRIARVNSDGTLDTGFNPNISAASNPRPGALLVQSDGKIWVGGTFTTVGSTTTPNIALLNTDGTLDTRWAAACFNAASSTVMAFAQHTNSRVLVAGFFNGAQSLYNKRIDRLARMSVLDTGLFSPYGTELWANTETRRPTGRLLQYSNVTLEKIDTETWIISSVNF